MFEDKIAALNESTPMAPALTDCEKRVYTVDGIQDILSISKTTAYNLVKSGVFRSVRIGGQHRISKRSFDSWLDSADSGQAKSQVCD